MTGIIAALSIEIEGFREITELEERLTYGGVDFTWGRISGGDVVHAVCGVGKVNAAICAQTMILKFKPTAIINTGVAGALAGGLGIGDIAIATSVVQHDFDCTAIGEEKGLVACGGARLVNIPCAGPIIAAIEEGARTEGIKTVRGVIASGDQFIASAGRKNEIVSNFGAIACEMEGGAIGQVCRASGVDFAVIRAISDSADGGAPVDFPTFAKASAERSIAVLKRAIKQI